MAAGFAQELNGLKSTKSIYAPDAEQAVLGGILVDPSKLSEVLEILKPESFYLPVHQGLFSIINQLFSVERDIDLVMLIDESVMRRVFNTPEMARSYLKGLMDAIPSTANIVKQCQIVHEKYQMRLLVQIASDIINKAEEGVEDPNAMLDLAEQNIFDIRNGEIKGLTQITEPLIQAFEHLQEITGEDKDKHRTARSGFAQLDAVTNGLNNSDLIIIAARPAMGKSAFALNIAVNMCKSSRKDVAVFSLEMGKEQLVTRMLSSEALVNNNALRSGKIEDKDWEHLVRAVDQLSSLPIYLDDGAGITVPQMKAKLRRLNNLGLVVIDYLQLMESPNKHSSRVNEVSEITRQLKIMAKELNVPVIALSQLSRSSEKRDDKRPLLSDLRESGSIEQDADIILFLYRDAYYQKDASDKTVAECIVAKNRHGQTDTINLSFRGEYTLFRGTDMRRDEN